MTLNQVIIHKIVKEKHSQAELTTRNQVLQITEPVIKLVSDINALYNGKANKGYGRFDPDEITYPVAKILKSHFEQSIAFVDASNQICQILVREINQAQLATGGYILMAHSNSDNSLGSFLIAIINNISSSAIKDESLEIIDSVHVDFKNVRTASKINLSDWLHNTSTEKKYISFLKQRGEVSDYFKSFLGCIGLIKGNEETLKLMNVLKQFSKDKQLDTERADIFFRTAYDFCSNLEKTNESISLDALSNAIWPEDPSVLQHVFSATENLNDGFIPHKKSLYSIKKIKAKTGYWDLNLDRHAISNGYAEYIKDNKELILRKLPQELIDELNFEFG